MLELIEKFIIETFRLFVEISPYLLLGFFFAGLLHVLLGEKYIKKHFAHSGLWPTLKATLFGIPLPVCSCAVIPLAESLRKDGASKSSTMAFLVSTPSSGVDSILATYALMGPVFAVFRPIASLFSGLMVGIITHLKGDEKNAPPPVSDSTHTTQRKKKSFKEIFDYGFKVIPSELSRWLLIGVVIGGAISAAVPADFGARYLGGNVFLNYAVILLISIPLYICATGSIPIAAALMLKGVLPGAALALLIAGPATNSVTISFVYKKMGKKVAAYYLLSIIVVSVATGLLFDAFVGSAGADVNFITAGKGAQLPEYFKLICAAAMALIFLNSKYNFLSFKKKTQTQNKEGIHTLKVPDMTCQHCKMKVTQSLEGLPGTGSISVDLDTKQVAVESPASRETILRQLKDAGYSPE
ncbi:MAG: hypothetical protein GY940_21420 [bacterium]|nr:hypothetical protein [bacterium]